MSISTLQAAPRAAGRMWHAWDRFWFTPMDAATLSLIRIFAGAMLLYTHFVWSFDLSAFFGQHGFLPPEVMSKLIDTRLSWSYFWYIDSPGLLWTVHILALVAFAMLTVGLFTRVASILAFLAAVSYANRVTPGAYFGLDKINCMLALYLVLGPSGARYSIDAWWRRRRDQRPAVAASSWVTVAIRLIQLHMCVIYFFSGLDKYLGDTWRDGSAVWWSVANLEYQSLNLTWLAGWPWLVSLLTYATLFWELTYAVLVWPRTTRPWVLAIAVATHLGIAIGLGMITFGLVMLIGNLAFVPSAWIRRVFRRRRASSAT